MWTITWQMKSRHSWTFGFYSFSNVNDFFLCEPAAEKLHVNPSSPATIASSRILQHWCCLPFTFLWNLYFIWPNLETYPSDVTKSPIQKCSKTLIGNFCLHGKKGNMLLAVFLFAWQGGISVENLIYINSRKPLRYTVAMITKHSNESARHY